MDRETVLRKVKALFRLADKARNNSEAEALTALTKARELLAQHNLSMADVMGDGTEEEKAKRAWKRGEEAVDFKARRQHYAQFEKVLAGAVAALTGTDRFMSFNPGGFVCMVFFGDEGDVAVAAAIFPQLIKTCKRCARQEFGPGWTPIHRSFAEGFACRIWNRVQKQEKVVAPEKEGQYAMVLANKADWLAKELKAAHPELKEGKALKWKGQNSVDAHQRGWEAGSKVDLEFKNQLPGSQAGSDPQLKN